MAFLSLTLGLTPYYYQSKIFRKLSSYIDTLHIFLQIKLVHGNRVHGHTDLVPEWRGLPEGGGGGGHTGAGAVPRGQGVASHGQGASHEGRGRQGQVEDGRVVLECHIIFLDTSLPHCSAAVFWMTRTAARTRWCMRGSMAGSGTGSSRPPLGSGTLGGAWAWSRRIPIPMENGLRTDTL